MWGNSLYSILTNNAASCAIACVSAIINPIICPTHCTSSLTNTSSSWNIGPHLFSPGTSLALKNPLTSGIVNASLASTL